MKNLPKVPIPAAVKSDWATELHDLLGWWGKNMVDFEYGGFYGRMDAHNRLHPQSDKGVIQNTRLLWSFATMTRSYGRSSYESLADRAYVYLLKQFRDKDYGGLFWMLEAQGRVVADKKQVYAQAFGIYSLSEYYRLTQDKLVLNWALELFDLIDNHSRDPIYGGYLEAFSRDWKTLTDFRLSTKDRNEAKSMNTHLHILEAYTNLHRVAPSELLASRLKELIELLLDRFLDPVSHHLILFFSANWEPRSEEISYGHDIEASWLICEAAAELDDPALHQRCAEAAVLLAEASLEGQDEDGGIINEGSPIGFTNTDKDWWPQFEAMVGWLNAWQISQDERFRNAALRVWEFVYQHHKDREGGEYHWCLNRAGKPNFKEDKAGPWKAPYHIVRSLMEAIRRTDAV
ncbi:MAG: AGE family epimerase/isomerase [Bacteroidia bacterium]|nr:AGE family epimerase/isomerase [Bacteroidia bacterium]